MLTIGLQRVSPGPSVISSISATSISGLLRGDEVTDTTLEVPGISEGDALPPPPPRSIVDGSSVGVGIRLEERVPFGSRTLMVTLLAVGFKDGDLLVVSAECNKVRSPEGVVRAWARSSSVEAAINRSADMLLYVRRPLSRRGRFLVPEESVSSIGSLLGGLGPTDCARVGVKGRRFRAESMTFC